MVASQTRSAHRDPARHAALRAPARAGRPTAVLRRRTGRLGTWLVLLVLPALLPAVAGGAECGGVHKCRCGDQVVADYTLGADIGPCPAQGLRVRRAIVLDGNGHLVRGSGARGSFGVQVDGKGSGARILNLGVTGFERGFRLVKAERVRLERVAAHGNGDRKTRIGYGIDLAGGSSRNVLERVQVFDNADEGIHVGSAAHENQIVDSEIYDNSRENVYFLQNHGNVLARSRLYGSGPGSAAVYIKHAARTVLEGNRIEGGPVHVRGASHDNRLIDNVLLDAGVVLQRYEDKDPRIGRAAPEATVIRGGRITSRSSCVRIDGATATTLEKVELSCAQDVALDGDGTVVAVATRVPTVRCGGGTGRVERARQLDVRLLDAAGKPLAGAELRVPGRQAALGVTDAKGIYSGLVVESVVQCPDGNERATPSVVIDVAGRSRSVPLAELRGDVRL
jgi:hypothetical protein